MNRQDIVEWLEKTKKDLGEKGILLDYDYNAAPLFKGFNVIVKTPEGKYSALYITDKMITEEGNQYLKRLMLKYPNQIISKIEKDRKKTGTL